ncbi:MAG: hypothetical protein Q7K20_07320 [Polaromonas sp.]|jgi:hypothetical protein|nr:hypothetical protein [Polaromonas sp.]
MGIVSFSASPFLSLFVDPLQTMATWCKPRRPIASKLSAPACTQKHPHQLALAFDWSVESKADEIGFRGRDVHRLKVVREFDSGVSPSCAGRMVISGRMADVCAELERMVQRETTAI